ncbi:MAG TPA: hypothetical protein VGF63_08290 [Solirubrobacteraceae bacterium]|jgi:hypothetical protein
MPVVDRIAERTGHGPAFDVSPRGVTPRPDPELDALLGELGDGDVPELRKRLEAERDPLAAFVWGRALVAAGTPAAAAALDAYADRIRGDDPWPGSFPGATELLRYLGR